MICKYLILIFFLSIKVGYANIIYDKNEITITDIEVNSYKNFYKTNFEGDLSQNNAIKNIVLMKKTINYLIKNNPEFISLLDKNIKSEYNKEIVNNHFLLNFIRFQKIRNEFISDYFENSFSIEDLEMVFIDFKSLRLPLSKNNCLTIEKLHEVNNDKNFIESLFKNLKDKNYKITTSINNELFDICLDNNSSKIVESEIIKFIENKIEDDFDKFIYRKK